MNIGSMILSFTDWVWGYPMLIWCIGGGLFLSARLGFFQFTKLGFILKNTIGKSFQKRTDGISSFKAVTGALAQTLGAGNIVGTAMAIAYGGPGGVFWLWVSGLVCCILKYAEVTMAMKYRHKNSDGLWEGGPQYYLTACTGWKWIGVLYAISAAVALIIAAAAQVGAGVDNIAQFGINRTLVTVIELALIILIVLGGVNRLLNVTEKLVPVMSVLYFFGGLIVILLNIGNLPGVIASIFTCAFTGKAAFGGFAGASVAMCIRWGVARGVYSNDAGLGVTSISHAASDEANHPVQQGLWGVFEVFMDTIVICSVTCLTILCTGVWETGIAPSTMTAAAFTKSLGVAGGLLVTISLIMFTFTTACAQTEFGAAQIRALLGDKAFLPSKIVYFVILFVGGLAGIDALVGYVDFLDFVLIFINMLGIYLCSGELVSITREYFSNPKKWETERYQPWIIEEQKMKKKEL